MTGPRSDAIRSTRALLDALRANYLEGQSTLQELVVQVCRHACALLGCDTVAVWLLKQHGCSHQLDRLAGFDAATGAVLLDAQALDGEAVTAYLAALNNGAFTSEEEPDEPRSLLDAAIAVNGSILGVLCCERRGEHRTWTSSETRIARTIANELAMSVVRGRKAVHMQRLVSSVDAKPALTPGDAFRSV